MLTSANLERRSSVDSKPYHSHMQRVRSSQDGEGKEEGSDGESTASFDPEDIGACTDSDCEYDATESESEEIEEHEWQHVANDGTEMVIGLSVSERAMAHLKSMAEKEMQKMRQTIVQLRKENFTLKATLSEECSRHESQKTEWKKEAMELKRQVVEVRRVLASWHDDAAPEPHKAASRSPLASPREDISSLSPQILCARISASAAKRDAGTILRVMATQMKEESVQIEGCSALLRLTPCTEAADYRSVAEHGGPAWMSLQREYRQLAHAGVLEGVVASAGAQLECSEVQEVMCKMVLCLSRPSLQLEAPAECDKLEAVTAAMRAHAEAEHVQAAACGALRNLAVDAEHQQRMLGLEEAGAAQLVLAAMEAHRLSARVQEHACGCLRNLAEEGGERQAALAAAGGVKAILAGMEAHAWDARVQEEGCGALRHLAFNGHARALLVQEGAVGRIVGAMEQHPWTEGVQLEALGALRILALEHGGAILEEGGLSGVLLAMAEHGTSGELQAEGCGALRNLAAEDEGMRARIGEAQGVGAVLVAMKAHAWHGAVQEEGCAALRNLAMDDACQRKMVRKGGAVVVRAAMKAHPTQAGVQEHAPALLEALSRRVQEPTRSSSSSGRGGARGARGEACGAVRSSQGSSVPSARHTVLG